MITEQCLGRVPGGTGRYTHELAAGLAAVREAGDDVVGWVARHPAAELRAAVIPGVTGPRQFAVPPRLLPLLWERGIGPAPRGADVVHAPTLLVPPRRPGVALVVTVHDTVPWTHPETMTSHGARWHRRMAARAAVHAAVIVVPTQAVAATLGRHLDIAGRLQVVGEGVSAAVLAVPADAAARAARLGLPPRYLLTVGTLEPRKGLDVALDAMSKLGGADGASELPLLVVGQAGWGGVSLAEAAASRGLGAGQVRELGRLADADLAVVYSLATVLLAPSRAEGFGLPVLEAMAHGVPVLVSDVPALVEVTGGIAGAGLVVPVGDAAALAGGISKLIADPAEQHRRGQAGVQRAAEYSWATAARELWGLYKSLG